MVGITYFRGAINFEETTYSQFMWNAEFEFEIFRYVREASSLMFPSNISRSEIENGNGDALLYTGN